MSAPSLQDGGIVRELSAVGLTGTLLALENKSRAYLRTMNLLGKPARVLTVQPAQFHALMKAARKGQAKDAPKVIGITLDGVPVRPAGGAA